MRYGWLIRLAGLAPAGLIAACTALPPATEEPPVAAVDTAGASAAATPIDWSKGDCLSQLRTLQQAASDGRLAADDQPPFAVQLVAKPGEWLDAVPQLPLEADLPLPVDAAGPAGGARCVIRIGPPRDQRETHRAIDVEDVRSAYQSGLRSERNPDYDAAQLAYREAREDAEGGQRVVKVGDPLLDLIGTTVGGLIGTVDRRVREHEVDDAAAALATTPRSRDRPVYRPYSFERVVVRAEKQAVVPVALLDSGGRELRSVELRQRERREFFVLHGLDPRDRDYEQHRASSMTRGELGRWARTPPALRLSSVALALTDGPAATGLAEVGPTAGPASPAPPAAGPSDLWHDQAFGDPALDPLPFDPIDAPARRRITPDARAAAPDDPSAASIVAIRAGSAAGNGFYVGENLVLTTYRLVGTSAVVDVTAADGATVPALVAAVDPARGLALLQVPRPGAPAVLYPGAAPPPTRPAGGLPGLPVLVDGEVVGMTGAAGEPVVPAAAIGAFLDSQAALLAAIP